MKKALAILMILYLPACGRGPSATDERLVTVTIAPYKYFITEIAGDDFSVNVMVPPGANPHIYEPYPAQIRNLSRSVAYLGNGFLGFEAAWMKRFEEVNKNMKKVMAGDRIIPIASDHSHGTDRSHAEAADPHYWVSPKSALEIAAAARDLVCELNPASADEYKSNYEALVRKIKELDKRAEDLFSGLKNRHFMIYHPNLSYIARDYDLEELAVEYEGKEPSPSRLKDLIDLALRENINTIFVQREYDSRNARAIAAGTGGEIRIIDPLSEDWYSSLTDIIDGLYTSLKTGGK